jgi:hypothetical protein
MEKTKVVEIMVERINIISRSAAVAANQDLIELEKYILAMQPQYRELCADIYDALMAKGIIKSE